MNHKTTPATADHKVDIFMPIFIGDYLKDTTFLTTEQHGAYLLMLFACWQHGAIPNNDRVICRTTGLTQQAWDDAKSVILPYFKIIDGKLRHSRIDRELEAAKQKKANFSERGKKGNDVRWKSNKESNKESFKDATRNPLATKEGIPNLSPSPSPSPSHIKPFIKPKFCERHEKLISEILSANEYSNKFRRNGFDNVILEFVNNTEILNNHARFIKHIKSENLNPSTPEIYYKSFLKRSGTVDSRFKYGVRERQEVKEC